MSSKYLTGVTEKYHANSNNIRNSRPIVGFEPTGMKAGVLTLI